MILVTSGYLFWGGLFTATKTSKTNKATIKTLKYLCDVKGVVTHPQRERERVQSTNKVSNQLVEIMLRS